MKTAILTDSTCNLSKEYLKENKHIFVLPLNINIDGITYLDQVEITSTEVYDKLDNHKVTTSLSSVGIVQEFVEKVKRDYDEILIINISSGLSGTHNVFRIVAEDTKDVRLVLFDSKTLAMGLGFLVMEASNLIKEGHDLDEVVRRIEDIRFNKMITIFSIDTLKYLREGGRIGKVEGTIADILRIKPVISVNDDGVYFTRAKARGNNKAISKIIDVLKEKYQDKKVKLSIHYGNNLEKAENLLKRLKEVINVVDGFISKVTPVLGVHTGPGIIGVVAYEV